MNMKLKLSGPGRSRPGFSSVPLELRWRLSLLIGVLLTAALTLAAWVAVSNTREAVAREVGAGRHTAEANLDLLLDLISDRSPGEVEQVLRRWSAGYEGGRHLCVAVGSPGSRTGGCEFTSDVPGVPAWFARGMETLSAPAVRSVASSAGERSIVVASDPRDELREAWIDIRGLLVVMGLLAFAVNACIFVVLSRGLRPLHSLVCAMEQIGRGVVPRLAHGGAHEMQVLSRGLGGLAARLAQTRETVRRLHLRNLDVQEDERRMVARELHDEIGHHVAAIELESIRIARMAPEDEAERQARLIQLRSSITEIHRVSRDLIHRLRPPAIESLGLSAPLESLLDRWRADHPGLQLRHDIETGVDRMPPARAVHVYRIVQESLSNIVRHARARRVWVWVGVDVIDGHVRLQVIDDGCGFDPARGYPGFGLIGMRERAEALTGTLEVRSRSSAGTVVDVVIPLGRVSTIAGSVPQAAGNADTQMQMPEVRNAQV